MTWEFLDVAGGTGDIAFRYINYIKKLHSREPSEGHKSSVTIFDINQHMLDVGKKRAERLGYQSDEAIDVDWICGDAEKLPFEDNQFTAYTIAFGIRNVTNIQNALNEAHRVLKVGSLYRNCILSNKLFSFLSPVADLCALSSATSRTATSFSGESTQVHYKPRLKSYFTLGCTINTASK